MKFIRGFGRFLAFLWGIARTSWVSIDPNLRPRSGASAIMLFLFFIFFLISLAWVLLGGDLETLDTFATAQGGWLSVLGSWLLRLFWGLVLLACAGVGAALLFGRGPGERFSILGFLAALVIGYFAWIGVTMSYS